MREGLPRARPPRRVRRGSLELHRRQAHHAARRHPGAARVARRRVRVRQHRRLLERHGAHPQRHARAQQHALPRWHGGAGRVRARQGAQARRVQRHGHQDVRWLPGRVRGRGVLAAGLHGRGRGHVRRLGPGLAQDGWLQLRAQRIRARPRVRAHGRGTQPHGPSLPVLVLVARLHPLGRPHRGLRRDGGALQHVAHVQRHPGLVGLRHGHRGLGGGQRAAQRHDRGCRPWTLERPG